MARSFYPILFSITLALAATVWMRQLAPSHLLRYLGAKEARAQSTAPTAGRQPSPGPAPSVSPGQPASQRAYPLVSPAADPSGGRFYPETRRGPAGGEDPVPVANRAYIAGTIDAIEFENAKIVARIGPEVILAGDVMAAVNEEFAEKSKQVPQEQWEAFRAALARRRLKQLIETKLIIAEARPSIPEENFPNVLKKFEEGFEKEELPNLYRRWGVQTRGELDSRLRQIGSSLDRQRRAFIDRTLAQVWVRQQIKFDEEITHQQMLDYYHEHLADYEFPSQVRWEQLAVRFSNFRTRQEAWATLAEMGNQVIDGAAFSDVAKARSQGPTAHEGGIHNWTTQGSLVSTSIDQALFALPAGALSPVLEDSRGLHVVRVIERKEAGRTPFSEAQIEIRKHIREQRINDQLEQYMVKLRERTPVWTIFDEQPADTAAARGPSATAPR